MLLWKKTERHSIRNRIKEFLLKKEEGDVSIYIIALLIIMFLAVMLKISYDKQRVFITYDSVDDAIVSALVGSSTYNAEELGLSGQVVIFETLTEFEIEEEEPLLPGETPPPEPTEEELALLEQEAANAFLTDPKLLSPVGDYYLEKSYNDFVRILKRNLKLDGAMNCQLSGIEGVVTIEEFAVYNRYSYNNSEGNEIAYRFVKYYYNGSTWNVYPYNLNTPVTVYSSYDHANIPLENTSVTARLNFDLRLSDYNATLYPSLNESNMFLNDVFYQRVVDIKK